MEEPEEIIEPWYKKPLTYVLALFLILLLVLWYFPSQSVKVDPEPSVIPPLSDVLPSEIVLGNRTSRLISQEDFVSFVDPSDPVIKRIATQIASSACASGEIVCQSKALFYFVRDNLDYVRDPVDFEYVEDPKEVLHNGGGDCESGALLLASLQESIGIDAQVVMIPGHAFLRVKLPEAVRRYKQDGDWVYLDWTCSGCAFGEIPLQNRDKKRSYMDVY